jgi:hypothetical protein
MKKFLCAWFMVAGCAASFALDRNAFTFANYDLTLRLEPEQARLGVRGKIVLRNDSTTPQKNLSLQISSSLAWRSIQSEGTSLDFVSQPYTSDIDHTGSLSEAIVSLEKEIPPKGTLELEIGYEGTIPLDATRLVRMGVPKELAGHTDWDQISSASTTVRGIGYVAWYPVAIEAANLAEGNSVFDAIQHWKLRSSSSAMRVHLCSYPSREDNSQAALMNDVPAKNSSSGKCGEHVFAPLGLTVPVFASGSYSIAKGETGETRFLADHNVAAGVYQSASDRVAAFVTEWFGAPKRKVFVVELSDPKAAPFESGDMLLAPLNFNADSAESTAVHQLTHAASPSSRPWIYEGLAHFAQALYVEKQKGREAALEFMDASREQIVEREKAIVAEKNANSASDESLINTSSEEFVRSKAMYVWWMLRDMLGEAPVKSVITSYMAY